MAKRKTTKKDRKAAQLLAARRKCSEATALRLLRARARAKRAGKQRATAHIGRCDKRSAGRVVGAYGAVGKKMPRRGGATKRNPSGGRRTQKGRRLAGHAGSHATIKTAERLAHMIQAAKRAHKKKPTRVRVGAATGKGSHYLSAQNMGVSVLQRKKDNVKSKRPRKNPVVTKGEHRRLEGHGSHGTYKTAQKLFRDRAKARKAHKRLPRQHAMPSVTAAGGHKRMTVPSAAVSGLPRRKDNVRGAGRGASHSGKRKSKGFAVRGAGSGASRSGKAKIRLAAFWPGADGTQKNDSFIG